MKYLEHKTVNEKEKAKQKSLELLISQNLVCKDSHARTCSNILGFGSIRSCVDWVLSGLPSEHLPEMSFLLSEGFTFLDDANQIIVYCLAWLFPASTPVWMLLKRGESLKNKRFAFHMQSTTHRKKHKPNTQKLHNTASQHLFCYFIGSSHG